AANTGANAPAERVVSGNVPRAARTAQTRNVANAARTEKHYDQAVADFQQILRDNRKQLDPRTVRALEDNLRLIDQAIAEARKALSKDSANLYLNQHLAENMQRKIALLRRASAIVRGNS